MNRYDQKIYSGILKGIVIFLLLFQCSINVLAQDTIYFNTGIPVPVTITEIRPTVIKYRKFEMPDGPDYVVLKRSIKKIVYSDSTTARLSASTKAPANELPLTEKHLWPVNWLKGQTHVNFIISDLLAGFLGFEAEHMFIDSRLGIRVPVSFGPAIYKEIKPEDPFNADKGSNFLIFNGQYGYYNENKTYSTGVEVYYYPSGKEKMNYYVGHAFGIGEFKYVTGDFSYTTEPYSVQNGSYWSFFIKNGFRIQPEKHLNIIVSFGAGMYSTEFNNYYPHGGSYQIDQLSLEGSVSLGYTF